MKLKEFNNNIVFAKDQFSNISYDKFILSEDYFRIKEIILNNENQLRLLITGLPGSGKTYLSSFIAYEMSNNFNVYYLKARDFQTDFNSTINGTNSLLIIDGLDECQDINDILKILRNDKIKRIIVTSRQNNYSYDFTHLYRLNPLSQLQIKLLIENYIKISNGSYSEFISEILASGINTTGYLIKAINKYLFSSNEIDNILKNLDEDSYQAYTLGKGLNLNCNQLLLPKNDIVIPPKEIIKDLSIINASLLERIKNEPSAMYQLSPRQFEEMICELIHKQGYSVTLTKETRDGGKDLIIVENSFLGGFLIYVECKRYDKDRPIGVGLVRELYGTISADKATAGMLITSSYFSKDAIIFQEKIKHQMELVDYEGLLKKIQDVCK